MLIADAFAVTASTLFVKEHTVLDVLGGAGVAIASICLAKIFVEKTTATN